MVRIWGGGVYQSDAFYDALDEAGILIYHDLMFTGSHKPPPASERAARDTLDAEIR